MQILINGRNTVIKKGTDADLVFENPNFGDVETWSMSITFPLRGCPENLAIFGHINRKDVATGYVTLPAVISHLTFRMAGVLAITEVNEKEAKGQFLAGRTLQNVDESLTEVKINKLSLGYFPHGTITTHDSPAQYTKGHNTTDPFGGMFVAVPWHNASTGVTENGFVRRNSGPGGTYGIYYSEETLKNGGLSFQIYLYDLTKRILLEAGFSADLSAWKESHWYDLLCMNTAPAASGVKAIRFILPDWTLEKYLAQIGLLMNGYFDIDFGINKVTFRFNNDKADDDRIRVINDIDSFTKSSTQFDESDYIDSANLSYTGGSDDAVFAEDACDWFIEEQRAEGKLEEFDSFNYYLVKLRGIGHRWDYWKEGNYVESLADHVAYCKDIDQYFYCKLWAKKMEDDFKDYLPSICKLNTFGNRLGKKVDNQPVVDLDIVPVSLMSDADRFDVPILAPGEATDNMKFDTEKIWEEYEDFISYTAAESKFQEGETGEESFFYNKIYVGFWLGWSQHQELFKKTPEDQEMKPFLLPPITDYIQKTDYDKFKIWDKKYSLRLNTRDAATAPKYRIDANNKYEISFLSDSIPSVHEIFVIKGRKFICAKLTAKLRETGFSQLIKGEFYMIED